MTSEAWQSEILQQIDSLPNKGTPGRIIVFGQNAEPILIGDGVEDVLVAAAEFGKGRIVCVSHNAYTDNFKIGGGGALKTFHDNVKKWLTRGTFNNNDSIIDAGYAADQKTLSSTKIIFLNGGLGQIASTHMEEWVRNGGGLFHCICPWGWLQSNKGKSHSDLPYYNMLLDAGICYTDEYIKVQDDRFSVSNNKAKDSHLLRVMKEVEKQPQDAVNRAKMINRLEVLPENVLGNLRSFVETVWKECNEEIKHDVIPSAKHPTEDKSVRALLDLWQVCFGILDPKNVKATGVDIFPGDFSEDPPLKYHEFEFSSEREEFYSTSCYLPAGKTMKLDVISENKDKDWQVMIGCHTDHLYEGKISRWPIVNRTVKIVKNTNLISSAFGGLVYFISPDKPSSNIKVKVDGVVDSPHFQLKDGENGRELWRTRREAPGLWADIEADLITFTMPSQSVRQLEFDKLTSTLKTWDSVVRLYHDLRGTDASKFRRQWVVADVQPRAGYMHAGYPIVTELDVTEPKASSTFLLDGESLLKEGRWGAFHEIGHNMQRTEWTFDGTREVTCNIFTLCAMDCMCHLKPWIHSWLQGQMKTTQEYFKKGAQFETWKSTPGIALFFYAQLIHAFGWESYKKVFRKYEAMTDNEKPKDDQKRKDTWFLIFSEVVRYNLTPLAIFWGIGISIETTKRLETAFSVAFLPDDEITQMSPAGVEALLKQFPNLVRIVGNSG